MLFISVFYNFLNYHKCIQTSIEICLVKKKREKKIFINFFGNSQNELITWKYIADMKSRMKTR